MQRFCRDQFNATGQKEITRKMDWQKDGDKTNKHWCAKVIRYAPKIIVTVQFVALLFSTNEFYFYRLT